MDSQNRIHVNIDGAIHVCTSKVRGQNYSTKKEEEKKAKKKMKKKKMIREYSFNLCKPLAANNSKK